MRHPGKEQQGNEQQAPQGAQDLVMRHSFFKSQLQQSIEELKNLEMVRTEHNLARSTLENVKELKDANECLMPIGANVFLMSKVEETQKVLVNVGSNIIIKKSIPEALSRLDSSMDELASREKELIGNIQFCEKELEKIAARMQGLQASAQKSPQQR